MRRRRLDRHHRLTPPRDPHRLHIRSRRPRIPPPLRPISIERSEDLQVCQDLKRPEGAIAQSAPAKQGLRIEERAMLQTKDYQRESSGGGLTPKVLLIDPKILLIGLQILLLGLI